VLKEIIDTDTLRILVK